QIRRALRGDPGGSRPRFGPAGAGSGARPLRPGPPRAPLGGDESRDRRMRRPRIALHSSREACEPSRRTSQRAHLAAAGPDSPSKEEQMHSNQRRRGAGLRALLAFAGSALLIGVVGPVAAADPVVLTVGT